MKKRSQCEMWRPDTNVIAGGLRDNLLDPNRIIVPAPAFSEFSVERQLDAAQCGFEGG